MRFVLIHGGYHGAWCWEKVLPRLERLGHTALAVDLPGAGQRLHETATLDTWRGALHEVIEDGDVLVGHSMGGFAISLAADEVPDKVRRLIYLSAAVPVDGEPMAAAVSDTHADFAASAGMPAEDFVGMVEVTGQGTCIRFTNQLAANRIFYHDCSIEDQDWAWSRLTPLPIALSLEPFHLPRFWGAPIPRDYIVTTDDRTHSIEMDNVFMGRLGLTKAFSIVSSHSPFISRPDDTAMVLDRCAAGTLA
jgi:pimeloyl-ACP methyl ester carboxylesterase